MALAYGLQAALRMDQEFGYRVQALRRAHARERVQKSQGLDAAMFTAELSALCTRQADEPADVKVLKALKVVREPRLYAAIERAALHALCGARLDTTGLVFGSDEHMLALSVFAFVLADGSLEQALLAILQAGGSTAREGALVASWSKPRRDPQALDESQVRVLDYVG